MFSNDRGTFNKKQIEQLLKPINPKRVLSLKGQSHVSQQDITAHLIRVFGFGGFDTEVVNVECVFETSEIRNRKSDGGEYVAWDVAYKALVRLTIRNDAGELVAVYEDGSIGSASSQPSRADAHDLAYKSAISLSKKRAAISLGDQFGLSLYNKGQLDALVKQTIVGSDQVGDVQKDVQQQVALGNDEIERDQ